MPIQDFNYEIENDLRKIIIQNNRRIKDILIDFDRYCEDNNLYEQYEELTVLLNKIFKGE